MYKRRRRFAERLVLIMVLITVLTTSAGCFWGSPTFKLIVENQTEQGLTIYLNDNEIGAVNPGGQIIKTTIPWDISRYPIKAIDTQGVIVFSKTLTRTEMQRIESRVYKIIIKPSLSQ